MHQVGIWLPFLVRLWSVVPLVQLHFGFFERQLLWKVSIDILIFYAFKLVIKRSYYLRLPRLVGCASHPIRLQDILIYSISGRNQVRYFSKGTIQLLRSHKLGGFLTPPPPLFALVRFLDTRKGKGKQNFWYIRHWQNQVVFANESWQPECAFQKYAGT